MKLAIISDTHDNADAVSWIIDYLNTQGIQTALHAGDIINPGTTSTTDYYLGRREKSDKSFVVLDLATMEHQRIMIPHD